MFRSWASPAAAAALHGVVDGCCGIAATMNRPCVASSTMLLMAGWSRTASSVWPFWRRSGVVEGWFHVLLDRGPGGFGRRAFV